MSEIITAITTSDEISLITVDNLSSGFDIIADIFTAMEGACINVDMISQTTSYKNKTSLAFTLPDSEFTKAATVVNRFKSDKNNLNININSSNCKISLFGEQMNSAYGVAGKVFRELAQNNINVKMITTSETDISILIDNKDADTAETALRELFNIK